MPVFIVRPSRGWVNINWREFWEYRDLLYLLIWREVKVLYKQTALGAAWVVIQPLLAMIIFSVFFGRLVKIPSEGLPYPIFVYTALLPWQFFAKAITNGGTSLVTNERIITKVYFPRLLIPTAVVLADLLDFGIAFLLLLGMMVFYGIMPSWAVLITPLFLLVAVMTALGISFWLSALDVKYRDVRYALPFLTQLWLFVTPVIYPSTLIPQAWRAAYSINPMAGVIEGFRWALLGSPPPDLSMIVVSTSVVILLFAGGAMFFRRTERTLADRI